MDRLSDRRLAENEVIFRQVNSEVKDFVLDDASDEEYQKHALRFYCECSNMDCRERIQMTAKEYDQLHKTHKQFILKTEHFLPEIEKVIKAHDGFMLVEKLKVPPYPKEIDPKRFF